MINNNNFDNNVENKENNWQIQEKDEMIQSLNKELERNNTGEGEE